MTRRARATSRPFRTSSSNLGLLLCGCRARQVIQVGLVSQEATEAKGIGGSRLPGTRSPILRDIGVPLSLPRESRSRARSPGLVMVAAHECPDAGDDPRIEERESLCYRRQCVTFPRGNPNILKKPSA